LIILFFLSFSESTNYALQMSVEMGYYWGKVDAEEALNANTN
jgi:hypothetical protein